MDKSSGLPGFIRRHVGTLLLAVAAAAVCGAEFARRDQQRGDPKPLDSRIKLYQPTDVDNLLRSLSDDQKDRYVNTELTLDVAFPILYVALLWRIIGALFTRPGGLRFLAITAGAADLAENAFIVLLVRGGLPSSPTLSAIAAFCTLIKFASLATVVALILNRAWRRLRDRKTGGTADPVGRISDVLEKELEYIKARRRHAPSAGDTGDTLIGLALSGGGIRSATTCLGMLQALSRLTILPLVDYVSTVSGGGYIGLCLSRLLTHRNKGWPPTFSTEWRRFPFNPDHREGRIQMDHLRTHGSFLITRTAFLSREALRSVGYLAAGVIYHLGVFLLALWIVSLTYMALVFKVSPDLHETLTAHVKHEYITEDPVYELRPPGAYERGVYRNPTLTERLSHKMHLLRGAATTSMAAPNGRRAVVATVAYGCLLSPVLFVLLICSYRRPGAPKPGESEEDARERALLARMGIGGLLATFILYVGAWRICPTRSGVLWLFIPAIGLAAALAASFLLHLILPRLPGQWNRRLRSLWGTYQAVAWFAFLTALLLALFPLAAYAVLDAWPTIGISGVAAFIIARFATSRTESTRHRFSVPTSVRHWILGLAVTVGVLLALVGLCAAIIDSQHGGPTAGAFARWWLGLFLAFLVLGFLVDANRVSPHYFYQDRLSETYLYTERRGAGGALVGALASETEGTSMKLNDLHGPEVPALDQTHAGTAPYHLVSAAINLASSRDLTRKDRKSGYFLFSKYFCGSEQTGYLSSASYQGGLTSVARAMTISGAAASSGIGHSTFFAQAFATVLFNLRLGYWMPSPMSPIGTTKRDLWYFWPKWLA